MVMKIRVYLILAIICILSTQCFAQNKSGKWVYIDQMESIRVDELIFYQDCQNYQNQEVVIRTYHKLSLHKFE